MTQNPISIADFVATEENLGLQTLYNTLIEDGSDELLPVTFFPIIGAVGIPRTVQMNILYY
jgi:hypothetical protein